jgi:hypothetical protein
MRLVVYQRGGYDDGADGKCFMRNPIKPPVTGGWDKHFRKQKHPIFWRLLKLIK